MDSAQYLVRKVEMCKDCDGEGVYYNPEWTEANAWFDKKREELGGNNQDQRLWDAWSQYIKEKWPCGEPAEEPQCIECEGTGKVEKWIGLRQALIEIGAMDLLHAPETRRKLDHIQDALNQTLRNLDK
jgi:hypothetical protein